jgi:hypothetical protein
VQLRTKKPSRVWPEEKKLKALPRIWNMTRDKKATVDIPGWKCHCGTNADVVKCPVHALHHGREAVKRNANSGPI